MDKLIHKLIRKAKKNKLVAIPALLCVFVLIFAKNFKKLLVDIGHMSRTKKLIAACMAVVLLLGLMGPIGSMFRSMRVNAGVNPFLADWHESQAEYYWYTSAGAQAGLEYTIDSVRDLRELADLVNGVAAVPGYGNVCDNFYGKTVYFNFTQLDMQCKEFPVIGQDAAHPFLGNFMYRPYDDNYVDSIDTLLIDHYYSEDASKQIFGYTSVDARVITTVAEVQVKETELLQQYLTQGSNYDFVFDGDNLYLPCNESEIEPRFYPIFGVKSGNDGTPWRGELVYEDGNGAPIDMNGIIASTQMNGILGIRMNSEGQCSVLARPGYDPANTIMPSKTVNINVVKRNTITIPESGVVMLELDLGESIALTDCGINAADLAKASAIAADGSEVTISGENLSNQVLTANGYGESKLLISSGVFPSDNKEVVVKVIPKVTQIRWNVGELQVCPNDRADYVARIGDEFELKYQLFSGVNDVTSYFTANDILVSGLGEGMNRSQEGNVISVRLIPGKYLSGNVINLVANHGKLGDCALSILVAAYGEEIQPTTEEATTEEATTEEATTEEATTEESITEESTTEESTTEESTTEESTTEESTTEESTTEESTTEESTTEESTTGEKATGYPGQVQAEIGSVVLWNEVSPMPLGLGGTYQGSVFGVNNGSFQMNRYHKVIIESNNANGGFHATLVDASTAGHEDGAQHLVEASNDATTGTAVFYVQNSCDFNVMITLNPTYEIRGNVVIYPDSMQNVTIPPTGQLLVQTGENAVPEGGKQCTYHIDNQGAENFQNCKITIQDVQSTNTNIASINLNGTTYDLHYDGLAGDIDMYSVDVRYADFPKNSGEVAESQITTVQGVLEIKIQRDEYNENNRARVLSGYIRPQDNQTVTANYSIVLNCMKNDEALLKQIYLGDELVANLAEENASVWSKENPGEDGASLVKIIYSGNKDLMTVMENELSFGVSDYATTSGVLQEGVFSPHLFLNKYEESKQLMFDVMVISEDGSAYGKYHVLLQAKEKAPSAPVNIPLPQKVEYDPLQYQYVITDVIHNALYSMEQMELIQLAGGDGEDYYARQQEVLRNRAQSLVEMDLLIYNGLQVNVIADTDYAHQYVPAKKGTMIGNPGLDGEDGVFYFKVYITSSKDGQDIIWEPIDGKLAVTARKYIPVDLKKIFVENGNVLAVLKDVPTECDVNKFEVEYIVDVLDANGNVMVSGQRTPLGQFVVAPFGDDASRYTIQTPLIAQREQRQRVTVYVRYHYDETTNEPYCTGSFEIAANDQCVAPVMSVIDRNGKAVTKSGLYEKVIFVKLTSSNAGKNNEIYYSVTDATGTTHYQLYSEPIRVAGNTTISAYAQNSSSYMAKSEVVTESFSINIPTGATSIGLMNHSASPIVTASGLQSVLNNQAGLLGGNIGAIKLWLDVIDYRENVSDFLTASENKVVNQSRMMINYCKNNEYHDYCAYDMRLMRTVTDTEGYVLEDMSGEITSTGLGNIVVTLNLPVDLQGRADLQMLCAHTMNDGSVQISALPDLDTNLDTYTFSTDRMSLYVIASKYSGHINPAFGEDPTEPPTVPPTTEAPTVPPTEAPTTAPQVIPQGGDDDDSDDTPSGNPGGNHGGGTPVPGNSNGASVLGPVNNPANISGNTNQPAISQTVSGNHVGIANGSNNAVSGNVTNRPATATNVSNNNAKTGDKAPILLLVGVLALSLLAMIAAFILGRKKK